VPVAPPAETRIALIGVLRCIGICVAITELAYLFAWMVLTLPLAAGLRRNEALSGLFDLCVGMTWAAAFGAVVGLTTTLTFNMMCQRATVRARTKT